MLTKLLTYLDGYYSAVQISLTDNKWHINGGIPDVPGWYFITTSTPIVILQQQTLWKINYTTKQGGYKKVLNYNIEERAKRYTSSLSSLWNTEKVYSGYASKLRTRAYEHTFGNQGTGALALSKYPALKNHDWIFYFATFDRFMPQCDCQDMVLNLGEQIWRSKNGCPILCKEYKKA